MLDGNFPQRFVQFIVDQQDVFRSDAVFTGWKRGPTIRSVWKLRPAFDYSLKKRISFQRSHRRNKRIDTERPFSCNSSDLKTEGVCCQRWAHLLWPQTPRWRSSAAWDGAEPLGCPGPPTGWPHRTRGGRHASGRTRRAGRRARQAPPSRRCVWSPPSPGSPAPPPDRHTRTDSRRFTPQFKKPLFYCEDAESAATPCRTTSPYLLRPVCQ